MLIVKKQGSAHTRRRFLRAGIVAVAAAGMASAPASAAVLPFWRHTRRSAGMNPSGFRANGLEDSESSNARLKRILDQYGSEFGRLTRTSQRRAST